MLYLNRKYFEKIGKQIGYAFSKIPVSPNQWTVISLILAFVTFYFLAAKEFIIAIAIFAFTAFIDMIDGAVARHTKKVTKIGGYLDSIVDRSIEFVIILGLFFANYPDFIVSIEVWLFLLLFGSFMSTYTRAAAFEKNVFKDLKGGILEHTDRLVFFLLIFIVSIFSLEKASILVAIMSVLTVVSALQRFLKAIKR
ncbi:MAG: CDP-alcohol phosphatidyltransferase family protein [Candidatus Aenigmatarchaeota archaeon]